MTSTEDAGEGHGTIGVPQINIDETVYPVNTNKNEDTIDIVYGKPPKYSPSPKHEPGHNWGSINPIKTLDEGQQLLDSGYKDGNQIYNVTSDGDIVKFQPTHTPDNEYHSYKVTSSRDIPTSVLKQMLEDRKISKSDYLKILKGKW